MAEFMKNNRRPVVDPHDADLRLDAMFRAYRDACPVPDAGTNFMPDLWAKIERRKSASIFNQTARFFVTAALAVTVLFGIILTIDKPNSSVTPGVYMEALVTDGESALNLLNPENLTEMEQQ